MLDEATTTKKILNPLRMRNIGEVFVEVKWDGARLSITGVEGPLNNGNARGGCGQIVMSLKEDDRQSWSYKEGWDAATVSQLFEVWERWHLNDMKAGTPKQEAFIEGWKKENRYEYGAACDALKEADLYTDYDYLPLNEDGEKVGYRYGTAWLTEEVPGEVIEWLFSLPPATAPMPTVWLR